MQQQSYQCQECQGTRAVMQLREVSITVGWEHCTVKVVAPCVMCARCGKLGVVTNTQIGRFMNLVPGDGGGGDGGVQLGKTSPVADQPTKASVDTATRPHLVPVEGASAAASEPAQGTEASSPPAGPSKALRPA